MLQRVRKTLAENSFRILAKGIVRFVSWFFIDRLSALSRHEIIY